MFQFFIPSTPSKPLTRLPGVDGKRHEDAVLLAFPHPFFFFFDEGGVLRLRRYQLLRRDGRAAARPGWLNQRLALPGPRGVSGGSHEPHHLEASLRVRLMSQTLYCWIHSFNIVQGPYPQDLRVQACRRHASADRGVSTIFDGGGFRSALFVLETLSQISSIVWAFWANTLRLPRPLPILAGRVEGVLLPVFCCPPLLYGLVRRCEAALRLAPALRALLRDAQHGRALRQFYKLQLM